jgi:hypothetical protein
MLVDLANHRGKVIQVRFHIADFEIAITNAIENWFPGVHTSACYFHLSQIIVRRLKSLKLTSHYASDLTFAWEIHCILSLAYLEPAEIPVYFNTLFNVLSDEGQQAAEWFALNYIEAANGGVAPYPPSFWSVAELIRQNLPKSQSAPEAYHHSIHATLGEAHVKLYKLIGFLKHRIANVYSDIESFLEGNPQILRSISHQRTEDSIKRILANKHQLLELEVLRAISRHVSL